MTNNFQTFSLVLALFLIAGGCGSDDSDPDGDGIASYTVTGTVNDFESGEPLAGQATITTDGLSPLPSISTDSASFTIAEIPPFSVFQILAGSPPDYRATYNAATQVDDADVDGVEVFVLSETHLADLANAFGVTPSPGTSVLVGRLVHDNGTPRAGVPADAFDLAPTMLGPFFLTADRQADLGANQSTESGYFVIYDVPAGLTRVTAKPDSGLGMTMADSPFAATAVTLANVVVTDGGQPQLPTNVSFENDLVPMFIARGCDNCHSGNGPGKDLGGLHLNGEAEKMYRELAEEVSERHGVLRVNRESPIESLMLTLPSREDPPDIHPNITFASTDDPDYLMILAWIQEGALDN